MVPFSLKVFLWGISLVANATEGETKVSHQGKGAFPFTGSLREACLALLSTSFILLELEGTTNSETALLFPQNAPAPELVELGRWFLFLFACLFLQ